MRATLFLCLAGLLFLSGCANYRLGSGGEIGFRTLYVAPVVNEAGAPQTVAIVSTQLREAFLRDPRIILVNTPAEADATLHVRLVGYDRQEQTAMRNDTGLARKFDITLNAEATLRDNRDNKLLFENRKVQAVRQVFTDRGQQLQAEFQNIPLLAEVLARNVVGATLDVW